MRLSRVLMFGGLAVLVAGAGAAAWAARHPEIAPIATPDPASFDSELVERGAALAGIGNCGVCHTRPGGDPYSGGLPLPTPFGTIYSTNITPDPETGIGAWSEEAFLRAMDEGVDRSGAYLYPAFPYDHFTKVTEEDVRAIYAYFMSEVEPVSYEAPENELAFPFNIRLGLAGWNLLFLDRTPWQPDPSRDEEWNRGAYLAQGLGHCGACHSPRNALGAVLTGADGYAGAYVEGWYAPALNGKSPAPAPWTLDGLVNYLIDGWDPHNGIATGPMIPVVNDLYEQSEDDVYAIAAYVLSLQDGVRAADAMEAAEAEAVAFAERMEWGHPENPPIPEDPELQLGARVFETQCANCHKVGGKPVPLGLTSIVNFPDATNLLRVTLEGIEPPMGALDRSMPPRDIGISDEEMVALLKFVRARFSTLPQWDGVEETVQAVRHGGH